MEKFKNAKLQSPLHQPNNITLLCLNSMILQ